MEKYYQESILNFAFERGQPQQYWSKAIRKETALLHRSHSQYIPSRKAKDLRNLGTGYSPFPITGFKEA